MNQVYDDGTNKMQPPAKLVRWHVVHIVDGTIVGHTDVGPCKTAFDAFAKAMQTLGCLSTTNLQAWSYSS